MQAADCGMPSALVSICSTPTILLGKRRRVHERAVVQTGEPDLGQRVVEAVGIAAVA
jgi:hypothetical protein